MTLEQLTQMCLRFRDERDWRQFHTPKDLALNLAIESAELMELMQWRNGDDLRRHLEQHKEAFADELADVLHTVLLLAAEHDVDLADAFVRKMRKNEAKYPVDKARGNATKYDKL